MAGQLPCEVVSWRSVECLAGKLAQKIHADGFCPEIVVTIARGGYVPARLLCDYLDINDLRSIRIVHYLAGAEKQRSARLIEGLCNNLDGKQVLLVDDISDTGDTLKIALQHIKAKNAGIVRIAVLHHKETSSTIPDYIGKHIRKWRWITYPWAIVEDVTGFIDRMPRQPSNAEEAARFLEQLHGIHLRQDLVEKILNLKKHH